MNNHDVQAFKSSFVGHVEYMSKRLLNKREKFLFIQGAESIFQAVKDYSNIEQVKEKVNILRAIAASRDKHSHRPLTKEVLQPFDVAKEILDVKFI